ALAAVALCVLGQILFPAPRIEEGHNVFLVDASGGALEAGLPREAFRRMLQEFDAKYPRERRCAASQDGCWRGQGFPTQTFAFSADGVFQHPAYSRRVTGIDFSDPIWLRLGFSNELSYNWNSQVSELARARAPGGAAVGADRGDALGRAPQRPEFSGGRAPVRQRRRWARLRRLCAHDPAAASRRRYRRRARRRGSRVLLHAGAALPARR